MAALKSSSLEADTWIRTGKGGDIRRRFSRIVGAEGGVSMGFFESEIVQGEARSLFSDYHDLMRLGCDYGKFDREGKRMFIERMEALMERYRVFMKRFELSDDFQARVTVEQLRTQLGQLGITPDQMFQQMSQTLERMKGQLEPQV